MYIKEVCIEGFKSYAKRTIVENFDPKFNAITGLNGSGKSNILDAICFVLGITNLQHVRAGSLQDLVYKQGQAGVNKATVSVTFNNEDKKGSPLGYDDHSEITVTREIVIGGRNKYKINGRVALPSNVQNLFHSVQLNVNNPHFLIMQGRITKVLNMKPPEILSMLEEAAGTRMYESKKENAVKTLEKKQTKVDEIDQVLSDEILPALEKLRQEKSQYQKWIQGNAELEKMKMFAAAFQYHEAEKRSANINRESDDMNAKLTELDEFVRNFEAMMQSKSEQLASISSQKEKEMGPAVRSLMELVDKLSKVLVKLTTHLSNKGETLLVEKKNLEQLLSSLLQAEKAISDKKISATNAEKQLEGVRAAFQELSRLLVVAEEEFQGIQSGKLSADSKSLEEALSTTKASAVESESNAVKEGIRIKHLQKELVGKKKTLQAKTSESSTIEKELKDCKSELQALEQSLKSVEYDEDNSRRLHATHKQQQELAHCLRSKVMELEGRLNIGFSYSDPVKGFDRRKVKGPVANLIQLTDKTRAAALEVVAGSKLLNIVVDSEQTGKLLLERGQLKKRVTLIPLNKIEGKEIPQGLLSRAIQLVGKDNVQTALSLVEFDAELKPAMMFVFGSHFVCKDNATAQKLAFHPDIMTPCVTLQGDVVSPSGLMIGGARRSGGSLLTSVDQLKTMQAELKQAQSTLQQAEEELNKLSKAALQQQRLKEEVDLKAHELALLEGKAKSSECYLLSEEVRGLEESLQASQTALTEAKQKQEQSLQAVRELERTIKDHFGSRQQKLRDAEMRVKELKKKKAEAMKALKDREGEVQRGVLEVEEAVQERAGMQEQLASITAQVQVLEGEVEELKKEVALKNSEFQQHSSELDGKRKSVMEKDGEMAGIERERAELKEKLSGVGIEKKKLANRLKQAEGDAKALRKSMDELERKCAWIRAEKGQLGQAGGQFDFAGKSLAAVEEQVRAVEAQQGSSEKRVNKRVTSMFDKAEKEYGELLGRKGRLEHDKAAIVEVIRELDQEKRDTLHATWLKVTKDFGAVFSTLLPGATARLDPPEGEPEGFMAGLEVKVAFGGVWKQSLSELSGGQRSLLALSLILALLLYKPAPLYILDEVDAALDLSHTQNIGRMIRQHFPHSQFLVVSLKEGMFNNASVLFRTKFLDGLSTVARMEGAAAALPARKPGARRTFEQENEVPSLAASH